MSFWELAHSDRSLAMVDAQTGASKTYGELRADVKQVAAKFPKLGRKSLGLLLAQNSFESVIAYLAALAANTAVIILDAALNAALQDQLIESYKPDWISSTPERSCFSGYHKTLSEHSGLFERQDKAALEISPILGAMLSTSGSTGSPKLVRLSPNNLQANADSIAEYLSIDSDERPITSLPMAYSYGLSVINSHLEVGASIVLSSHGVLQREFWKAVEQYSCTSMAGVPYSYELLLKTGLLKSRGSTLKTLTQAGGRLREQHVQMVADIATERGWKFFVMYGQTEASARISYVPFDKVQSKAGSIGIPIPNGSLRLDEETRELIYSGPNVMLGYAECIADLAKADELKGVLRTGDLAQQDSDGYFYITGRMQRFLKLFGKRFNLDDIERLLTERFKFPLFCYGTDDLLMVAAEEPGADPNLVSSVVQATYSVPAAAIRVEMVKMLPRMTNGKIDYQALVAIAESGSIR